MKRSNAASAPARSSAKYRPDDQAWPEFDLPQPIIYQQIGKITWDEAADYMAQLAAFVQDADG